MAIDFTLTQRAARAAGERARLRRERRSARACARRTRSPTRCKGFQMTKDAYVAAYKAGIAFCMLPQASTAAAA